MDKINFIKRETSFPLDGIQNYIRDCDIDHFLHTINFQYARTKYKFKIKNCKESLGFIKFTLEELAMDCESIAFSKEEIAKLHIKKYQVWAEFDTTDNALLAKLEVG